jgi:hypothetical protein
MQRFYAHLAISICVFKPPPGKLINDNSENRTAYSVAGLVLKAYVQDCVDLVVESVKKRINTRTTDKVAAKEAQRLKRDLIKWKGLVDPLAYSPADQANIHTTLNLLIGLVVENTEEMQYGLNLAKPKSSITYKDFAAKLYAMGRKFDPEPMAAPVQPKGTMASLLPLAVKKLATIGSCTPATEASYITDIFARCASALRIEFIPWHSGSQTGGRRALLPRHDHWVVMEKGNAVNAIPRPTPLDTMSKLNPAAASQQGSQYMVKHNSSTPWRGDATFSEMACIKIKVNLPEDWDLQNAAIDVDKAKDALIQETYLWAQDNYDGRRWQHKLAIMFAILMSKIVPFVYITTEDRAEAIEAMKVTHLDHAELTAIIRAIPWKETTRSSGSKGAAKRRPYTTMMSTFIMAWMDRTSPIRVQAKANKGASSSRWTHKHGELRHY